jgi:hypothetical protein
MKIKRLSMLVLSATLCCLTNGCKLGVGTPTFGVTGSVATGGQIIGIAVNSSTNAVAVSGSYAKGTNSYAGGVTIGN